MKDEIQHIEEYDEIIYRLLIGRASEPEISQLRLWLSNPDHREYFDVQLKLHFLTRRVSDLLLFNEQQAWLRLYPQLSQPIVIAPLKMFWFKYCRVAAIVIFIIFSTLMGAVLGLKHVVPKSIDTDMVFRVPYGSKSQVVLPDGSTIWLNAGSYLRYSTAFNRLTREVYMEGEGFFDIHRNVNKPFFVKTRGVTIKVLGTAFNVKAFPGEKTIETTVQHGLVQVVSNNDKLFGNRHVLLHAHQMAVFRSEKLINEDHNLPLADPAIMKTDIPEVLVADKVDVAAIISWKEKNWLIESEDLESLAIKIERRYNVKIQFDDNDLKKYIFSGVLKDESLEQVLNVIQLSAPVSYSIQQKIVTLHLKNFSKSSIKPK